MSGPTFIRHRDAAGAWVYEDEEVHFAYLAWALVYGFNLSALDDYLNEPGWETQKAQKVRTMLIERRARALRAQRDDNKEALFAWLNFLTAAMQMHRHREELLSLARQGKKHGEEQALRREGKPATSDDYDADRNARIRRLHASLVAAGAHDHTEQVAGEFALSNRQIQRIVNKVAKRT